MSWLEKLTIARNITKLMSMDGELSHVLWGQVAKNKTKKPT